MTENRSLNSESLIRVLYIDDDPDLLDLTWAFLEKASDPISVETTSSPREGLRSIVSHDLRNPLNVAEGHLELAQQDRDSKHLHKVERAHDRMEKLIDDLLTLAREGQTVIEPETIDLTRAVETCWQNIDSGPATLVTDTDCLVKADRNRLKQLLENLLRNALEHGGSTVTIRVGDLDQGFYVEDDGPGISRDQRGEVLRMGYSTTEEGTGFGLSIVERIADAHGWEIAVTGGSEGGARIEVTDVTLRER